MPPPESATPQTTTADLSLTEHEAQFGPNAVRDQPEPPEPTEPTEPTDPTEPEPEPDAAARARDASGKFAKTRQRAKSQQASPADVPRIAELTRRLRETEAELARVKTSSAPPAAAQPAQPPAAPAPAGEKSAASPDLPWEAWASKPEPVLNDYKDYGEWIKDWNRWDRAQEQKVTSARNAAKAEEKRVLDGWSGQVTKAREKYDDFDAVALQAPTRIPQGSLIDAWILEDDSGADVLYHLQTHPDELDGLLALPVLKQAKALSLLSQRLLEPPVATEARATPVERLPRPPSSVRTGPTRAAETVPGDEASLADHEKHFGPKSRRH